MFTGHIFPDNLKRTLKLLEGQYTLVKKIKSWNWNVQNNILYPSNTVKIL